MKMDLNKSLVMVLIAITLLLLASVAHSEILVKQITETFTSSTGTTNTLEWTGYGKIHNISASVPEVDEDVRIVMEDAFTGGRLITFDADGNTTTPLTDHENFDPPRVFQGTYNIETYCNKSVNGAATEYVKIKIVYEK